MNNLQELLAGVEIGKPIGREPLCLVPLFRPNTCTRPLDYMLGVDALERQLLRITEVGDKGTIDELNATNLADSPALILGGEELIGGMQNRIANTDVLIGAHSTLTIPVSCCEEDRWSPSHGDLRAGVVATPRIRASSTQSVSRSLQTSAVIQADQSQIWKEIAGLLQRAGCSSPTNAMSEGIAQHRLHAQSLLQGCSPPPRAVGVIAVKNGQFVALDLFDRPQVLSRLWERLSQSYVSDNYPPRGATISGTGDIKAMMALESLRRADCVVRDGVGMGKDWRFETMDLAGSALTMDDTVVHLSAFPRSC